MRRKMRGRRRIQECSPRPTQPKQRPHFIRIILKGTLKRGDLMIPPDFASEFLMKIGDVAVLKIPTGEKWEVTVKKVDGSVRFQNGLLEFLKHHSISVGDFLMFKYNGNSTFSVFIFNQSACEIDYPSNADDDFEESNHDTDCLIPVKKEPEEDEDPIEPLDESPLFEPLPIIIERRRPGRPRKNSAKKQKNGVEGEDVIEVPSDDPTINETNMSISIETSSLSMGDDAQNWNPDDADNSLPLALLPSGGDVSPLAVLPWGGDVSFWSNGSKPSSTATQEVESDYSEQECRSKEFSARNRTSAAEPSNLDPSPTKRKENLSMFSSQGYKKVKGARKRLVSNQQIEKAFYAARMFRTENPSFVITMKPSYVYRMTMNFPRNFTSKYLNHGIHNVKLSVLDGRTWTVRCYLNERKATISGGWTKFVRDNKLEEGDCCVFELSKAKGMELKVSIFHIEEADQY